MKTFFGLQIFFFLTLGLVARFSSAAESAKPIETEKVFALENLRNCLLVAGDPSIDPVAKQAYSKKHDCLQATLKAYLAGATGEDLDLIIQEFLPVASHDIDDSEEEEEEE